jgi:hypothetical protein
MGKARILVAGTAALALIAFIVGCGGDSSTGEPASKPDRIYPWVHGATREFLIDGGDNAVQTFGPEASDAEREKASRVIQIWMRARVAEDWKTDCRYLSTFYVQRLVKDASGVTQGKATSCTQALEYFGDNASGTSGNTLTGPIASLLVRGKRAYAQWHGPEEDWVLPLRKEDGQWKVDIAAPLERTK